MLIFIIVISAFTDITCKPLIVLILTFNECTFLIKLVGNGILISSLIGSCLATLSRLCPEGKTTSPTKVTSLTTRTTPFSYIFTSFSYITTPPTNNITCTPPPYINAKLSIIIDFKFSLSTILASSTCTCI